MRENAIYTGYNDIGGDIHCHKNDTLKSGLFIQKLEYI